MSGELTEQDIDEVIDYFFLVNPNLSKFRVEHPGGPALETVLKSSMGPLALIYPLREAVRRLHETCNSTKVVTKIAMGEIGEIFALGLWVGAENLFEAAMVRGQEVWETFRSVRDPQGQYPAADLKDARAEALRKCDQRMQQLISPPGRGAAPSVTLSRVAAAIVVLMDKGTPDSAITIEGVSNWLGCSARAVYARLEEASGSFDELKTAIERNRSAEQLTQ